MSDDIPDASFEQDDTILDATKFIAVNHYDIVTGAKVTASGAQPFVTVTIIGHTHVTVLGRTMWGEPVEVGFIFSPEEAARLSRHLAKAARP